MRHGNNHATAEKRVVTSDARFDMRLTENFDDEVASSSGWTWVIAILIAGMLIVSGYLDQESAIIDGPSAASVVGERNASSTSVPLAVIADARRNDRQRDKGY